MANAFNAGLCVGAKERISFKVGMITDTIKFTVYKP